MSEQDRLEINWFNVTGSALGAVSAAIVLSTLGTAGTLIGAAMGSLCITVGGAVYAYSLRRGRERLAAAQTLAARRPARSPRTVSPAVHDRPTGPVEPTEAPLASAESPWRQTLRELPWKRILAGTALLFAIAMAIILTFEVVAGRSLSSFTGGSSQTEGGTSIPGISGRGGSSDEGGGDGGGDTPEDQDQQQSPQDEQSGDPEAPAPAEETTPAPAEPSAPAPEPTAPSEDPQPSPAPQL